MSDDVSKADDIPVVNLTFEYILTPLIQLSARRTQARPASAQPSEIDQHVQQLSDLARQLMDVITKINQADPTVLASVEEEQPPVIR